MSEEGFDAVSQASPQFKVESNESWDADALVVEAESKFVSESVPESVPESIPEAAPNPEADETTGASPGTAQACSDLGLSSLAANLERLGIKPPGQS